MKKKFSLLMVALLGIVGLSMAAFRAEANSLLIQFSDAEGNAVELTESFSSGDFKLTRVDTDGKHAIDANNAWFGDANTQVKFTHRLKTGGKSGSKNSLSLTIPAEGKLYICARTGSNNAIDRNLVLTQNEAELYNKVVQESDAVSVAGLDSSDPEKETNVYPIISVEVAAGTVEVTYPTNSLNFYAFEFVPAGSEEPVAETKTVTFVNDQNWEKVYVYAWTTENGTTTEFAGAWPGTEITADAEGNYTWSTTDSPANIIFNNGAGTQTANLAFEDGATYNSAGKVIPGAEKTTFTATFKNSIGWEEIYAYAYTEDAAGLTETLGSWPGTKMTKNEETGVWSISFDAYEAPANIIFNNGNSGEGNQTEDFVFVDGQEYDMEVPATDIEITVDGGDIAEALNAAKAEVAKVGQIIINLKEADYTVSSTLEAPAALYINGNGATIDASALEAPFITMSATPTVEENNTYYRVGIGINDLTLNGLKNSIFYDNNVKYCATGFYISNCVMQLATEAVANEALISFKGGGAKDFYVKNSTFYGNASVAKYFVRYNNSARLDRYGYDTTTEFQSANYENNTFYNLLKSDGQWANYNGMAGQKYTAFDVKNNIWMNCGENLIARRLLGGRGASSYTNCTFENNTYAHVDAESGKVVFETEGTVGTDEETGEATNVGSYDVSGTALTTDPNFKDAENGDFAVEASTAQALYKTGDQRWGTWTVPVPVEAGYYLVGNMNDWKTSADYAFKANEGAEGEYMLTTDLAAGAEFKVVYVDEEQAWTWYPAEGDNYSVNDEGNYTVYFRPEFNTEWNSYIYIQYNGEPTGINTAKVVSLNGAEVYNLNGQRVQSAQKGLYIVNGRKVVIK